MTRKQEVLNRLMAAARVWLISGSADGGWVNGSDLATAEVGGSEGLKRLRELRAEGWPIEERRHPDPRRAVWQYRLNDSARVGSPSVAAHRGTVESPPLATLKRQLASLPPDQVVLCDHHTGRGCIRCGGVGLIPLVARSLA